MGRVSVVCFLASYALALAIELFRVFGKSFWQRVATLSAVAAGLVAQTIFLYVRSQTTSLPPLLSSMQDWMYVLAWLVALVYLFVSLSDRDAAAGVLVLPLILVLVVAAQFFSPAQRPVEDLHRNWTMLHVVMLVFGIGGLLAGLVVSLMYLWQHWRLKNQQMMASGWTFPSLERLHRWNKWLVMISVPLLTLGMAIGVGLVLVRSGHDAAERVWSDPLVVLSLASWLVLAAGYVWMLVAVRTPGRQMAYLTAFSTALLLVTMLGSQALSRLSSSGTLHGPNIPKAAGDHP
jgi:ABC-type uncharacterized transport system permease subunit